MVVRNVELKKLDSFGRWMDKEIGVDCDDSLMASDSDWAYSGTETKVLIVGSFLGSKKDSADTNWGCMFGEIEVSAEILSNNAIRCQTPLHAPGRVPFYVTGRNRLACSEIREFEYRKKPFGIAINNLQDDELHFQIRLAKLLSLGSKRKWLICAVPDCDKCKLKSSIFSMQGNSESDWVTIDGASVSCKSDHLSRRDSVKFMEEAKDHMFWIMKAKASVPISEMLAAERGFTGHHILEERKLSSRYFD
ncbi:hypothetical protein ACFX2J_021481 [Malus domestica]